jgi:polyprenyl P-hydroxybenzoate/phenylacrylic acid decarboxylase-like protein
MNLSEVLLMPDKKRLVIGISGASGSVLGVCALKLLRNFPEWESHLVLTRGASLTIETELEESISKIESLADVVHPVDDLSAVISSGSFRTEGMLVAPCSMKTAAGIACGYSDNLLLRAADVTIKERRRMVLLTREAPLSYVHLRNLLTLSEIGAIIIPPVPAFYQKPVGLDEIVRYIVGRALSYFGLDETVLYKPWEGRH